VNVYLIDPSVKKSLQAV